MSNFALISKASENFTVLYFDDMDCALYAMLVMEEQFKCDCEILPLNAKSMEDFLYETEEECNEQK